MILAILELACRGFWHFLAVALILGGLGTFLGGCWKLAMRSVNVRKHGWPPEHLDADGDSVAVMMRAAEKSSD